MRHGNDEGGPICNRLAGHHDCMKAINKGTCPCRTEGSCCGKRNLPHASLVQADAWLATIRAGGQIKKEEAKTT